MIDVLPTALAHHAWANLRLLDVCAGLSDQQLAATVDGTMGSVIDTLRHVVGGDAAYLELLTDDVEPVDESTMDVAMLREVAARHARRLATVAAADRDPAEIVTRHNPEGDSSAPLAVRLAQIAHHGSEHRSQVCTILTQLGVEPPELDVWAWAEEQGLLEWVEAPTADE